MSGRQKSGTSDYPLILFRAYLLKRLSASSAEHYVKQARRALREVDVGRAESMTFSAGSIAAYDATLSLKMRENFRAAWRHYVAFARSEGFECPLPPSRGTQHIGSAASAAPGIPTIPTASAAPGTENPSSGTDANPPIRDRDGPSTAALEQLPGAELQVAPGRGEVGSRPARLGEDAPEMKLIGCYCACGLSLSAEPEGICPDCGEPRRRLVPRGQECRVTRY